MLALTHLPSSNLHACERTYVPLAPIDHARALEQHAAYCAALQACRARVVTLDVNKNHPDATFLEDTAIVLDEVAVLASMGTASRSAEPAAMEPILRERRPIVRIDPPATLEGGDVLRVGRTLLVGRSARTNSAGIALLAAAVEPFGYQVVSVPVHGCLHLKTGCTALPDGRLLVNPAWVHSVALNGFELVEVPSEEPFGANVCLVYSDVLLAAAHVRTGQLIESLGFRVRPVDLSEFAKAEGGATCLSLLVSD